MFSGEGFEREPALQHAKGLLQDFFRGRELSALTLKVPPPPPPPNTHTHTHTHGRTYTNTVIIKLQNPALCRGICQISDRAAQMIIFPVFAEEPFQENQERVLLTAVSQSVSYARCTANSTSVLLVWCTCCMPAKRMAAGLWLGVGDDVPSRLVARVSSKGTVTAQIPIDPADIFSRSCLAAEALHTDSGNSQCVKPSMLISQTLLHWPLVQRANWTVEALLSVQLFFIVSGLIRIFLEMVVSPRLTAQDISQHGFSGPQGLDRVMCFSVGDNSTVLLRQYRIRLKKTGTKVELPAPLPQRLVYWGR